MTQPTSSVIAHPDSPEEKFQSLTQEALNQIPTRHQLQQLNPEQAHHLPEPLLEAGGKLGKIAQLLHDHPELTPQGLKFYDTCAREQEFPASVRALCLANHRNLSKKSGNSSDDLIADMPEAIRNLAENIP